MSQAIVSDAMKYWGKVNYKWAGWLPSTGWDCSGAVGYWLGHDLGMKLPLGTTWSARSHPPVAASYKTWRGASTVTSPAPGDLCCWLTHIGVYVGGGKMISALSPQYGTDITPVTFGPRGEHLTYRRVGGIAGSAPVPSSPGGCVPMMILAPVLLLAHLRRPGYDHRRADVIGDHQAVEAGQLVDDPGEHLAVPAGLIGQRLDQVPVAGPPDHDEAGLPGRGPLHP